MVVGFSQMVVLASGGLNLSVGAIGVCSVMTIGYLLQISGLPISIAICGGLALGALLGWVNGFAIARLGVSSFVCTLGAANLFTGGMLILTKGQPFDKLPPEVNAFGLARVGGVPTLLLAALAVGLGLSVLYGFTSIGRQLLAAGANPRAASMSGVRVGRMIVLAHALSGFLAGAAGGLIVAQLGAALPSAAGEEWLVALVSRASARRHGSDGGLAVRLWNDSRGCIDRNPSQRAPVYAGRQFLDAALIGRRVALRSRN